MGSCKTSPLVFRAPVRHLLLSSGFGGVTASHCCESVSTVILPTCLYLAPSLHLFIKSYMMNYFSCQDTGQHTYTHKLFIWMHKCDHIMYATVKSFIQLNCSNTISILFLLLFFFFFRLSDSRTKRNLKTQPSQSQLWADKLFSPCDICVTVTQRG